MRFLSVFCIVFCVFLWANEQKNIRSIESDFVQTIVSAEGDVLKYTGNFQAQNDTGGSFALWDYRDPIRKKIFFNNSEVVMVEPDLEQVVITTVEEMPDISDILNKSIETNKQTNRDVSVVVLDVKYNISFFDGVPTKITYTDKLENDIEIALKNTTINVNIDKLTFIPSAPPYYDVVGVNN